VNRAVQLLKLTATRESRTSDQVPPWFRRTLDGGSPTPPAAAGDAAARQRGASPASSVSAAGGGSDNGHWRSSSPGPAGRSGSPSGGRANPFSASDPIQQDAAAQQRLALWSLMPWQVRWRAGAACVVVPCACVAVSCACVVVCMRFRDAQQAAVPPRAWLCRARAAGFCGAQQAAVPPCTLVTARASASCCTAAGRRRGQGGGAAVQARGVQPGALGRAQKHRQVGMRVCCVLLRAARCVLLLARSCCLLPRADEPVYAHCPSHTRPGICGTSEGCSPAARCRGCCQPWGFSRLWQGCAVRGWLVPRWGCGAVAAGSCGRPLLCAVCRCRALVLMTDPPSHTHTHTHTHTPSHCATPGVYNTVAVDAGAPAIVLPTLALDITAFAVSLLLVFRCGRQCGVRLLHARTRGSHGGGARARARSCDRRPRTCRCLATERVRAAARNATRHNATQRNTTQRNAPQDGQQLCALGAGAHDVEPGPLPEQGPGAPGASVCAARVFFGRARVCV
jgi:hypothetical protein